MSMDLATESSVTALGNRFFLARSTPRISLPDPVLELDGLDAQAMATALAEGELSALYLLLSFAAFSWLVRYR